MAGKLQGKTVLVTGEDYKVPAAYRTFELNNMVTSYNKVVLVTGSTDGIGKHTAERLAKDGATVLVHGRYPVRSLMSSHRAAHTAPTYQSFKPVQEC